MHHIHHNKDVEAPGLMRANRVCSRSTGAIDRRWGDANR